VGLEVVTATSHMRGGDRLVEGRVAGWSLQKREVSVGERISWSAPFGMVKKKRG